MQVIYSLLAIMLLGLFSLNMLRGIHFSQNDMVENEVATQLTSIGTDVLEFIGRTAFDENVDESKISPLSFPIVTNAGQLTTTFGGCTALEIVNPTCDDLDDFDGLVVTRQAVDLPYTVTIAVRYVDPNNPTQALSPSFAKEVRLTITSPLLTVNDTPIPVTLTRVFTYNRITST